MAGALHYAEKALPWANCFTVLAGHDSGDLMQVGEVVGCPSGEQLRQGDGAEGWVAAGAVAGLPGQVQGAESAEDSARAR